VVGCGIPKNHLLALSPDVRFLVDVSEESDKEADIVASVLRWLEKDTVRRYGMKMLGGKHPSL
jgi:hypothetical protein